MSVQGRSRRLKMHSIRMMTNGRKRSVQSRHRNRHATETSDDRMVSMGCQVDGVKYSALDVSDRQVVEWLQQRCNMTTAWTRLPKSS
eukprot:2639201-Rhodomonas_salina.1